jgi:ABC-type transport system substrate-binding protein
VELWGHRTDVPQTPSARTTWQDAIRVFLTCNFWHAVCSGVRRQSAKDRVADLYVADPRIRRASRLGDVQPLVTNSETNVWTVNGSTHLWNLSGKVAEGWEGEIDQLMRRQLVSLSFDERRQLYGRIQDLVADNLPIICLASPHVLVGVNRCVQNVRPSILRPYALRNADALFLDGPADNR